MLIITDIDGTLLRYRDYALGPAAEALEACRRQGVPVVLCSSKTRAEQIPLRHDLNLTTPFIVENGAAIYIPEALPIAGAAGQLARARGLRFGPVEGGGPPAESLVEVVLGTTRAKLVAALAALAAGTGLPLRGLSSMDPAEVAGRLGLGEREAERAMQRAYSEPFAVELEGPDTVDSNRLAWLEALRGAAAAHGFSCTLGDRLFSLQGRHSKGDAFRFLVACYEASGADSEAAGAADRRDRGAVWTMALGDSWNDAEMLSEADEPVLVRRHDGTWAEGIAITGLVRTEGEGPEGWHQAVMERLTRGIPTRD